MESVDSLFDCYVELSTLEKQLHQQRISLINNPYVQSHRILSNNSYYFPYYALVEKYADFADQYVEKLSKFKELLVLSLQKESNHHDLEICTTNLEDTNSNNNHHDCDQCTDDDDDDDSSATNFNDNYEITDYDQISDISLSSVPTLNSAELEQQNQTETEQQRQIRGTIPGAMNNVPSPSASVFTDDTYLPTLDEDKETVYSYHSYNLPNANILVDISSTDDIHDFKPCDHDNGTVAAAITNGDDDDIIYNQSEYDDNEYDYSSESDEDCIFPPPPPSLFYRYDNKPIYCSTLIYISFSFSSSSDIDFNQFSEDKICNLLISIGGLNKNIIENVMFKTDYRGHRYCMVRVRESLNLISLAIEKIRQNDYNIIINIFRGSEKKKLNVTPNRKLYVNNFDILDENCHHNLSELFAEFGELDGDIFINIDENDYNPYALVQFKHLNDAIKCFNQQNDYYSNSLYISGRMLRVQYMNN